MNKYVPGTILQDSVSKSYWIVLQSHPYIFLETKIPKVANLFNGHVRHIDQLVKPKQVTHLEIVW